MKKIFIALSLLSIINLNAENLYIHNLSPGFLSAATESASANNLSELSCSYTHCLALKNGEVWVLGTNNYGQLGIGNTVNHYSWYNTNITATAVKVPNFRNSAILKDGTLWLTGWNGHGQLGNNNNTTQYAFFDTGISLSDLTKHFAMGLRSSYAITGGTIYSTGYNYYGQLGLGNTSEFWSWQNTNQSADEIDAAYHSAYALNGSNLLVVGDNFYGQIGRGGISASASFYQMMTDVKKVETGYYHSAILKNNGEVWTAGYNQYGQLGLGHNNNYVKTYTNTTETATDIEAGIYQTYLFKNNELWSVGAGGKGQLALGSSSDQNTFQNTNETIEGFVSSNFANGVNVYISGQRYFSGDNQGGILASGNTSDVNTLTATPDP